MRRFRDRPIKQKLAIITLVTTGTALALAGIGNVLVDSLLFRGYLRRDLSVLARVIADNSTAALSFNDPEAAAQALAALKERSHVSGACMYRNTAEGSSSVFAQYAPARAFDCPQIRGPGANAPSAGELTLTEPIVLNGRTIGTLLLIYDLGEVNERIRLYGSTTFGVFVIATLLGFLFSNRLREMIATPVSRLVRATTAVSETGDYAVRVERLSGDELGLLVDRFNEMLSGIQSRDEDLKKALREVEKERARFRFMAESMPQKIFTAKPEGEVDYFNRQWMEFTGLTFEQIEGWNWTQLVHPDDLEGSLREWRRSLETGEPCHLQQRFRGSDGKYRWHLSRARAMRDTSGNITMWIGSCTDIHEQKEKEEELRRANEDLQQFAYSASHDLQEPIRNVAVYSEIVAGRYHDVLDAEGKQYLEFLMEGGRRLATLVHDLLSYTRATMAELSESPVNSSEVLESTLASLAETMRETSAVVTADDLPQVHVGELHFQQVLQNLIGNALKYKSDQPPRIHVSARRLAGMWRFSVRDNGIGIDPLYKEKIFGLFKRLSHERKHGGNGIGLAICQRVVERYGGRIWVESEPGKGATFFFTVPEHAHAGESATVQSSGS